jgi:2-polyprenyl-3-methyl-5-hydroxy-6-metoxy-1,4-benzoquinol methylase
VCGSTGTLLYSGLEDRLAAAPGSWDLKRCDSGECGLIWLDPRPIEEDLDAAYSDYPPHEPQIGARGRGDLLKAAVVDAYLQRSLGYTGCVRGRRRLFLSMLGAVHPGGHAELAGRALYLPAPPPGARLIDVGCGTGEFMLRMQRLGWEVEGVEPDPDAVSVARSYGLRVTQGDVISSSIPPDSADAVTLNHVIEHVPDPVAVLRRSHNILKPGGRLVVSTPNADSLGHALFGKSWFALEPPRHTAIFGMSSMHGAMDAAGIAAFRISTTARGARGTWALSRQIRRAGRVQLDRAAGLGPSLAGVSYQLIERLLLLVRPDRGEDLLVIAERQE